MAHNQPHEHFIVGHAGGQMEPADRVKALTKRLRSLEDLLLLLSIPALLVMLLLWALGAMIGVNVPFIAFVVNLLVTWLTLITAYILLFKWIDTLQAWGYKLVQEYKQAQRIENETTLGFMSVSGVLLLLIGLILGTTAIGGGDPRTALQILLFPLLGWHYRTLVKRELLASFNRQEKPKAGSGSVQK